MTADPRLSPLPHFDLNCGACRQIVLVYAETTGGYLHNGVLPVTVEVFMQPAFAGVVVDAERISGPRQTFMRVVADGTVTHSREHDRHRQGKLRRECAFQPVAFVSLHLGRLFAQEYPGLHRFAQGIDGRIGHL